MDIEILLFLQNLREATGGFLNNFFIFMSTIAVDYYILIPVFILFWTLEKKQSSKIVLSWGTSLWFGALLKTIFCIYRPWVRDARIVPAKEVMGGATGYSFPSGHSFSAGGFWNAIAINFRKYKAIVVVSIAIVLTTMFSRIFLGVHTPQDILVGAGMSLLVAFLISKLIDWVEEGTNRDIIVMSVVTALMIGSLLLISLKSYPMDYVDGVLLVDPTKMTVDGFKDPGLCFGLFLGWFLERRFVKYDPTEGSVMDKVKRALVGGLLALVWGMAIADPIGKVAKISMVYFITHASTPILFMYVYPLILKKMKK